MMRTLSELARACNGELKGADAPFAGVVIDSRKLSRGDLFVALAGEHTDGPGRGRGCRRCRGAGQPGS